VSNFLTKILSVEGNKNSFLIFILNLIPYFLVQKILYLFKINYLYKKDDIIYYSKENQVKLGPILLEALLNDSDIKSLLDNYDNNVPINLIFENENIKINDSDVIKVKYLAIGKMNEKTFKYKSIKYKLKIELLYLD
tara:strand:- start:79 stop:489 length:411 start_codon:yes stop_codon:yes gene_type:complete